MVLCKRNVPPVHVLHKIEGKYSDKVPKEKLCQYTNQATLAGVLTQLTMLTQYADEMFTGLMEEAGSTYDRIKNLTSRTQKLQTEMPKIDEFFKRQSLKRMNETSRVSWRSANSEEHQHFTRETIPNALHQIYKKKCSPPPNLVILDEHAENEGNCLGKYTYPQFFIEEWIMEQKRQLQVLKEERKARRAERAGKRKDRKENVQDKKKPRRLKRIRYDPNTGEKIVEVYEADADAPAGAAPLPPTETSTSTPAAPPAATENAPAAEVSTTSSTKKKKKRPKKSPRSPPKAPADAAPLPPPAPEAPSVNAPPPPPMQNGTAPKPATPTPAPVAAPPPPAATPYVPPPPPTTSVVPPPPPPMAVAPPPPPMGGIPPPPAAGMPPPAPAAPKGGLLSQIRMGASLKTPTPVAKKPATERSGLIQAIQGGIKLKSASARKLPEKKASTQAQSVADILARRIAIQPDSDSDSEWDNSSEDEWSD